MADEGFKRKLTAILSADVIGYSRLMRDDEEATVRDIAAHRVLISDIVKKHHGRVVDSPGDNILAEFASVVDAVNGAIKIQQVIKSRNKNTPKERRMEFRIGINLGDVIEEEERIYGDGVNIAARVEGLASAGGIAISGTVYEHIKEKLSLGYHYLGEKNVKNISEPVRVYRLLTAPNDAGKMIGEEKPKSKRLKWATSGAIAIITVVSVFVIWNHYFRPSFEPASVEKMAFPLPEKPSIAVLPFNNMSDDPKQAYFSDGITEEIITALSKTPKMLVISRNSAFSYKEKAVKIKQIAEELGVKYVLEGSVRKESDRVRITAQLIDALAGHHLWAERYDRELKDIFSLQDEITKKIITALHVELTDGELARFAAKGTENLQAYLKLMQAREPFYTITKEGIAQARHLLKEAITHDPEYAAAYMFLGATHWLDVSLGSSKSPKDSIKQAFEFIKKAQELDEFLPEARSQLGWLYMMTRQYDKSIAECERAITLAPNSANAHIYMGLALKFSGRHKEAVRYSEQALRLDPLPPPWYSRAMGSAYSWVGRHEEALTYLEKAKQSEPNDLFTNIMLAVAHSFAGRMGEARTQAAEILEINPKYSIEQAKKSLRYKRKTDRELFIGALRQSGIPEHPPLPLPDKPSIAILPFANMSGDPEQQYFSDGITEQIITSISKVPHIFVIARQSSFSFRDKQMTVQQIAMELGVRYILEGSLQRSGERLRINAQLIDATSGNHIWAENYDRILDDIFAVQDDICKNIMVALQVKLTWGETARIFGDTVTNIRAYEKFLKGNEHFYRRTKEDSVIAQQLSQEAITLDPGYASPYQLSGLAYMDEVWLGLTKTPSESIAKAEAMVQKVIAIEGYTARVNAILGWIYFLKRDFDKALAHAEKAVQQSPNYANAYLSLGVALRTNGQYEAAISNFKKALRLNPIRPINQLNNLAWAYLGSQQHEKAISTWNETIERNPDYFFAHQGLTAAHWLNGSEDEARQSAKHVLRINPNFTVSYWEKRFASKDKAFDKQIYDAWRKAGLPE